MRNVKIFVSYVSAHQRVASAEKDLNHQVDSMTPVLDYTGHGNSGHGGRDGGDVWTQQHGLLFTLADLATAAAECSICLRQRSALNGPHGTLPQGDQPATW